MEGAHNNELQWERDGRDLNFFSPAGTFRNAQWLKSASPVLTRAAALSRRSALRARAERFPRGVSILHLAFPQRGRAGGKEVPPKLSFSLSSFPLSRCFSPLSRSSRSAFYHAAPLLSYLFFRGALKVGAFFSPPSLKISSFFCEIYNNFVERVISLRY